MSKAQKSEEVGSAEESPAELGAAEASPIATTSETNSRRKRHAKLGTAPQAVQKPVEHAAPAGPAADKNKDAPATEKSPSVAELTGNICRNPEKRRKRLKVAEALRECGMDESRFADTCFGLTEKLSCNVENGPVGVANAKLLLEVLKEVAHYLEPPKTAGANEASDAPQFVRLIHNVPRPVRTE